MKLLIALLAAAPLLAQNPCTYDVNPSSFSFSAAANTGSVQVTRGAGSLFCGDFFVGIPNIYPWLKVTSGDRSPGAFVTFTVAANPGPLARSGFMVMGDKNVSVAQAGRTDCVFGMTPAQQNFPVGGGNATLRVQGNCPWQTGRNAGWITLNAPTTGSADATVSYSAAPNLCAAARSGIISLATNMADPPSLAVTQEGAPGNISLSAYSVNVGAAASDGRIDVRTGLGCGWTAFADVSWIQITAPAGGAGSGDGGISYRLLQNTAVQRTGNIRVGALTYTITQQAPAAPAAALDGVTNAASYGTDAVSPGQIVALFGSNMGPDKLVLQDSSSGTFPDSLAGTRVFFDDVAAPILYTLKGQVSAVVPYSLAGKTSTQVKVQYQGVTSNIRTMPVRSATPAIFTIDTSGIGPGAILNQDNSINSTGNPAARLSVISLYCTGGGVTTPPTADGEVVGPPLRRLVQDTVVTIGGVNATVQYAGAAPGSIAGLTQINVEVPAGVAPSLAVPVVVKIGGFTSNSAVTVSVK